MKKEKKIPSFEFLVDAINAGYAKKRKYLTDVSELKKQKHLGIEWGTIIIVKPFHFFMNNHRILCDELGESVVFGMWCKTSKGNEESELRQKAWEREYACDLIKGLNGY